MISAVGAYEMYITNTVGCASSGTWTTYSTHHSNWSLSASNAVNTVYIKFRDQAGNESGCASDSITHDSNAPTMPSIVIAAAATHTNDDTPDLSLSASNADEMYITNSSGCTSSGTWESYNVSKLNWSLDSGDFNSPTAMVYVKFRDFAGNETSCISDSISHDNIAPSSNSISINSGSSHTFTSLVTLDLSSTGANEMYVTNTAGCASGGAWEAYSTTKASYSLGQTNATATVYVQFKDDHGNSSACINDTIVHDDIGPTGTITIAGGASTNSVNFVLNLTSTENYEMYITNSSGCAGGGTWETFSATKSNWAPSSPNSSNTVYAKFRDQALNESPCYNDDIIHDTIAPSDPSNFTINPISPHPNQTPAVNWDDSTDSGSGINYYQYAIGTSSLDTSTLTWTNLGGSSEISAGVSLGGGTHLTKGTTYHLAIRAIDYAGNVGNPVDAGMFEPNRVGKISAGEASTCALFINGIVKCWGVGIDGALGNDSTANIGDGAGEMGLSLASVNLGADRTATDVQVGDSFVCAILDTQDLKCWGKANSGATAQGNTNDIGGNTNDMAGLGVVDLNNKNVVELAVGDSHMCVIFDDNKISCFGYGWFGNLGYQNTSSRGGDPSHFGGSLAFVNTGATPSKIAAGYSRSCIITTTGTVKCWGKCDTGQLGNGSTASRGDDTNEMGANLWEARNISGISKIAAGGPNTCVIKSADNSLKCWGQNQYGEAGQGHTNNVGHNNSSMDNLANINLGTVLGRRKRGKARLNKHF